MIRRPPRSPLFPYTPLFRSVLAAEVVGQPPLDALDCVSGRQDRARQHLSYCVELGLAKIVLKERDRRHQWNSRFPLAAMMGMWRIHIWGRHQASFFWYHTIVRSSPSVKEVWGRQSSSFAALEKSHVWRNTWPGRSPINSIGT